MRVFDQLDWVHSFDDYQMFMYVRADGLEDDGVYMQMLHRSHGDGAEFWDILYDRQLFPLIGDVVIPKEDPTFEDEMLRRYLHANPNTVDDEKTYLTAWLKSEEMRKEGKSRG